MLLGELEKKVAAGAELEEAQEVVEESRTREEEVGV